MSGETENQVSGWTVDTLRAHLLTLINEKFDRLLNMMTEKDVRDQQRFDAQQLALRDALTAQEKAVNAALTAAEQAVQKAESAAEKRFDAVNEFRAQLADQAQTFMPRNEAQVLIDGQTDKITALEIRLNNLGISIERINANSAGAGAQRNEQRAQGVDTRAVIALGVSFAFLMISIAGVVIALVGR
jgi:hypothetical protein